MRPSPWERSAELTFTRLDYNDSGQVTGVAATADGSTEHAFLYSAGKMTDLGAFGQASSKGNSINASGQIAGQAITVQNGNFVSASGFIYGNGTTTLTSIGLFGINDSGQAVGTADVLGTNRQQAVTYHDGKPQYLGALGNDSMGTAINNAGQVTGDSDRHAFLYTNGKMMDLGTLAGPNASSSGTALNASGEVTGTTAVSSFGGLVEHAFLYSNGVTQDIGSSLGNLNSKGISINAAGQIVGSFNISIYPQRDYRTHALLYTDGSLYDLNNLVSGLAGPDDFLTTATGINNVGQIIAKDYFGMAYLLEPAATTPEPAPAAYLALAAAAWLGLKLYRGNKIATGSSARK